MKGQITTKYSTEGVRGVRCGLRVYTCTAFKNVKGCRAGMPKSMQTR